MIDQKRGESNSPKKFKNNSKKALPLRTLCV